VSTRGKPGSQDNQRIPDELVDAFFDRRLDEGSREKFFQMLRGDVRRCAEVAQTQRVISALREPVEAPDLTASIMREVSVRRGFLSARLRGMVRAGRMAVAAGLLLALLGVALVHRMAPDAVALDPAPRPVSGVVSSSAEEAATRVQQITGAVDSVKMRFAEPVAEFGRLLANDELPQLHFGEDLSVPRVYIIGPLEPGGLAAVNEPSAVVSSALGGGAFLSIDSGAGGPQFTVPAVVYVDQASSRIVLPKSDASASGPRWAGRWQENLFLLQQVETSVDGCW
jgi:hypothetical protein